MNVNSPYKDPGPHVSIPVGIAIGLVASFVQSLGLTIQRKSHVLNQALPTLQRKADYRRPLWLLGFTIFFTSNILGSIFQIASLPVVILAPLGAVSLLWNAFFARLILGDVFSKFMIIGTLFIGGGAVLIAIFGIVPEPTHSLEDLLILFGRKTFVIYFSLLGTAVGTVLIITHIVEWTSGREGAIALPLDEPEVAVTLVDPTSAIPHVSAAPDRTPLLDPKPARSASPFFIPPSRTSTFLAISYASISGLLSGMCLLFAKSGVELLVLTVAGKNQFWRWESWALVTGLVVFALLQLWYLHRSLKLADPTLVCPLAFCAYNLSSIVNGLVYYDQFGELSTKQLILVVTGIVILLGGVWAVSLQPGEDEQSVSDGECAEPYFDDPIAADVESAGDLVRPLAPAELSDEEEEVILGTARRWGEPTPAAIIHRRGVSTPSVLPSAPPTLGRNHSSADRRRTPRHGLGTASEILPRSPSQPNSPRRARKVSLVSPETNAELGVPAPLGGFSIGLSPMSPGFALVPHRRRTAGAGAGDEGAQRASGEVEAGLEGEQPETPRSGWGRLRDTLLFTRHRTSEEH